MLTQVLLVIGAVVLFIQPIFIYVRDSKGLKKFPSPFLAGFSSLWRVSHSLYYRHYRAIHQAHQKLGTHIRIAPNHISVSDPRAVNDIYGHGANMLKEGFYDGGAGHFRNMADARDKVEHQSKRKLLAHVFSQKTIANLEPVISDTIGTMLKQLDRHALQRKPVNLRSYLNYFTIDVFSKLLTSESLGCLDRGDDIVPASAPSGCTYHVAFIRSLHKAMHINTILGFEAPLLPLTKALFAWHPYRRAGSDYENIIYRLVAKRFSSSAPGTDADIFSKLLKNNKNETLNLPLGALLAEAGVMMNGGTDTTTAALSNTIFLLYKHPSALAKLRAELDGVQVDEKGIHSYNALSDLPYLRACIEESLRLRPASSMGLPRIVPEGGRTIAGQFVAGGVTVSVPTYSLLRDSGCFAPDPDAYRPERWLTTDKQEKARMMQAHFPFSTGPRACIGRNIAYFEQLLVIATLIRIYDFEFVAGKDFELKIIERFNSNPGEMPVWVRKRVVA